MVIYWPVKDNTGIKIAKKLTSEGCRRRYLRPGDVITVFPRKYKYVKTVQRKRYSAIVLCSKRRIRRKIYYFDPPYSSIALLTPRKVPAGTKIFGISTRELEAECSGKDNYKRLLSRIAGRFL